MRFRSQVMKSSSLFVGFCLAALLAAGCGTDTTDPAPIAAAPNEIVVGDAVSFSPPHLTVTVGTTVRWRNAGPFDHTVTSGTGSRAGDVGAEFDAKLPAGGGFEFTFDTVGDHPYFCRPHEGMGMKGTVTVTAAPDGDAGTAGGVGSSGGGGGGSGDTGGGYGGGYGY